MGDLLKSTLFAPMATAILAMEGHPTVEAVLGIHGQTVQLSPNLAATLFHYEEEPMEQPGS